MTTSYEILALIADILAMTEKHELSMRIARTTTGGEFPTVDISVFQQEKCIGFAVTFDFDPPESVIEELNSIKAEIENWFCSPEERGDARSQ